MSSSDVYSDEMVARILCPACGISIDCESVECSEECPNCGSELDF